MPVFTLPDNATSSVNCPPDAIPSTPPVVKDACGNTLTPIMPTGTTPACNGTKVYTFTYTDCAGNKADWTYTYTITMPVFALPANGASTVNCPADAVAPTPPTVKDACGNTLTPVMT